MSILIKPGYKVGLLTVRALAVDGNANQRRWLCDCECGGTKITEEAQAVPVPPHGDLIDRAELKRKFMYSNRFDDDEQFVYLDDIDAAPTIIPASEEGK